MPKLNSVIDASSDAFAKNAAHNRALVEELRAKVEDAVRLCPRQAIVVEG